MLNRSTPSLIISFHPKHLRESIPVGQFLRVRRNCSNITDFRAQAKDLTDRFRTRGYPKKVISKAFLRARDSERQNLLQPAERDTDSKPCLVTTYNNQWRDIYQILQNNWDILLSDSRLHLHIPKKTKLISRRAQNLKDALTSSHFQRPTTSIGTGLRLRGSFPCGDCSICPRMVVSKDSFLHPKNHSKFRLRDYVNCRTKNVIYVLQCSCPMIYVGQTGQELRRRIQQHLSSITTASNDLARGKKLSSVATHFLQVHHGSNHSLRVYGLEKIRWNPRGGNQTKELLKAESRWIYHLDALSPLGLNEDLLYTGFYKD
ncbi:uncharacterized protein [Engystomops pustulosus]|uniref:uncharacterized protein n=1 Tax=Engystomops pustulosus TaxID=76066 RepID=UPI003AFA2196